MPTSTATVTNTIEKKTELPHQNRRAASTLRRSTVTNALLCFLGIGGLASCALLGYVVGLHLQFDEERGGGGGDGGLHRFRASSRQQARAMRHHRTTTATQEQDKLKWRTIPDGWEKYTFTEMRNHFNCVEHALDQTKPLPSLDEWTVMRKLMKLLVDPRLNLDDPVPPTQGYSHGDTGAPPPYYAQHSEGKGRGLFASRDITEGELVQDGPHSIIAFPDAISFRRLVFALPRKSGCDITEWAWHQQLSPAGNLTILVDANIAALMNSSPEPNIAPKTKTETRFYAVRDINKGEEILFDYNIYETDWTKVGLE